MAVNVIEQGHKAFMRAVMIELNRSVKKKLTGEYLGVFTGMGRNTTNAIMNNGEVLFGTYADYMFGYETGDFSEVKEYPESRNRYYERFRGRKNNRWTGDRKHRPFMKDSIESPDVIQAIFDRYIGENR